MPVSPAALSAYGWNYDIFCNATAANGVNKVWECYVAGLDPTDSSGAFLVHIAVADGVTSITWTPDLGNERIYTIFGREALETGEWMTPTNSASKFFKVKVETEIDE